MFLHLDFPLNSELGRIRFRCFSTSLFGVCAALGGLAPCKDLKPANYHYTGGYSNRHSFGIAGGLFKARHMVLCWVCC